MAGGDSLVVVIAPDTSEEAGRLFAALLSAGFHPSMDYGGEDRLANYPILTPQAELGEARAFLKGLRAGQPAAPARATPSVFGYGGSDRPTGDIPPWTFKETVGKAVGVLLAMLVLVGAVVAVVQLLAFLGRLRGH